MSRAKAMPPSSGPPKAFVPHLGEERPRHAEDHRDQVDDEAHEQHRVQAQVAQAVDHGRQPHPPRAGAGVGAVRRQGRQPEHRPEGGEQAERIHGIQGRETEDRDQRAAHERAADRAELHDRHVEGVAGGQLVGGDEPREHRRPGRLVDGEAGLLEREDREQHPDVVDAGRGLPPEEGAGRDEAGRGREQQPPATMWSARAPPQRPKTTSGTSANSPASPTIAELCVSA